MNFAQLFQNIQKKDPSKLSVSEMALMVRFNTLKERLEDEESVMSALENEFNIAEQVRTNASASATTTGTGSAKEFVPENVLMTSLIDLGDKTEDYSFLWSLVAKHTLNNTKQTVPVVGRPRRGRVLAEQSSSASFRVAKEGIQNANSDKCEIVTSKLYNNVQFTEELSRYSVIQLEALFLGKLKAGLLLDMANAIINGDTANTTSNINNKGTAPSTTYGSSYNQLSEYAFDNGLRKIGLAGADGVTKINVGTLAGADDIIDLQALVTSTMNPQRKIVLMDSSTYYTLMKKDDFKKASDNGKNSTIYTGAITNIAGSDIFVTGLISKADNTGSISITTPANNVTGTIIVFDVAVIQHGDFDVLQFNNEKDFAVSSLLEVMGFRGFSNINGKDGVNFVAVGYNCVA